MCVYVCVCVAVCVCVLLKSEKERRRKQRGVVQRVGPSSALAPAQFRLPLAV